MKPYDWLVVGAGFTGAVVAERLASQFDQRVLVVDKRPHIGGNAYDERDQADNLVHRYGPHIFHTNSARVFHYLSQFTEWRPYFHRVLGHVDGALTPIPFNLNSIVQVFPAGMAERLADRLVDRFGFGARPTILKLREAVDDPDLQRLADYIYEKVFLNYTTKQWGRGPEDLDPSVTARVPVAISRDDRYFTDRYQAMPKAGFTSLFARLLDHPNIEVEVATDFSDVPPARYARSVYTGAIDAYFDYQHGALPYRSLRFEFGVVDASEGLPVGTVNYPNEFDFTRTTDFRHLTGERRSTTSIVTEYPEAHEVGRNDPYYPIPSTQSKAALSPYRALAEEAKGKVWFAGRLADYQYYNMDQACARALTLVEKELAPIISRAAA